MLSLRRIGSSGPSRRRSRHGVRGSDSVRLNVSGPVSASTPRTVKVILKARKSGKVKASFEVDSDNAGGKTAKKTITVRK